MALTARLECAIFLSMWPVQSFWFLSIWRFSNYANIFDTLFFHISSHSRWMNVYFCFLFSFNFYFACLVAVAVAVDVCFQLVFNFIRIKLYFFTSVFMCIENCVYVKCMHSAFCRIETVDKHLQFARVIKQSTYLHSQMIPGQHSTHSSWSVFE